MSIFKGSKKPASDDKKSEKPSLSIALNIQRKNKPKKLANGGKVTASNDSSPVDPDKLKQFQDGFLTGGKKKKLAEGGEVSDDESITEAIRRKKKEDDEEPLEESPLTDDELPVLENEDDLEEDEEQQELENEDDDMISKIRSRMKKRNS